MTRLAEAVCRRMLGRDSMEKTVRTVRGDQAVLRRDEVQARTRSATKKYHGGVARVLEGGRGREDVRMNTCLSHWNAPGVSPIRRGEAGVVGWDKNTLAIRNSSSVPIGDHVSCL